ncbi:DHA2 family multidrug resistance protein-like MFS transporter [Streptosporangium becharense]|uniref:DHA2 family multidrug resistance protein-like MFS transporter n=1 Tax=Streptosporangium becharense TaxID=1816182 RepID=A0A7W9IEG8_9ACTN|nr:MFS transporter [Streptosporangium becharense]MBB2909802.1 DHA2 family multidrug resistance protein-like MFS transporter [Streptosporangium becharense]MBB5819243.1 DHA2 family multidrug resistance protein-like MFS transporter [Streptosporangium becharense]
MTLASAAGPVTGPAAPHPRRWAGLAVLSASLLLVVMDMTILNVALPAISADLRPGAVELLWMVDVYSLVLAGLLVTASALGDRWGRKKMLLTGFAIFGLASTTVLWAGSPAQVIAVRALLGVGGAMIMPSTLSMIRTLFPDARERATALGVWSAMASLGAALGPILGGLLLEHFSWHAAFLVNVPVMAVAVAAGLFLLPESRNPAPGRWDAAGTVLSIAGMVALVYSIKQFGKEGVAVPGAWVALGVAAVTLGWFARRCLTRPDPLLEVRLFRSRPFSAGALVAVTTSVAMAAMMLLMAQWMQLVQGYSPLETGVRLLPTAVGALLVSPVAPALASRIGTRAVLSGGLAVSGLGFGMLAVAPMTYPWVAAALFLVGLGMGSLAIASAAIMAGAPPEKAGSAAAVEETSYELGGLLGVAVLGSVAAAVYRGSLPQAPVEGVLSGAAADAVRESLGGALEVAQRAGTAGAELVRQAKAAFSLSLEVTGLAGGGLMLVAALVVWWLVPRDLDVTAGHH